MAAQPSQFTTVAKYIREELKARDWTQDTLAEVLGVSLHTVSALVTGKRNLTVRMAWALHAAFDGDPFRLMIMDKKRQLREWRKRNV